MTLESLTHTIYQQHIAVHNDKRTANIEFLVNILPTKADGAFESFLEALRRSSQDFIAERLTRWLAHT